MQFDEFKAQVIGMFPSPAWSQYDAWKFFRPGRVKIVPVQTI